MSTSMNDFNVNVIEEFRANGGDVGGMFAEMPILLLHHTAPSRERCVSTRSPILPTGIAT